MLTVATISTYYRSLIKIKHISFKGYSIDINNQLQTNLKAFENAFMTGTHSRTNFSKNIEIKLLR